MYLPTNSDHPQAQLERELDTLRTQLAEARADRVTFQTTVQKQLAEAVGLLRTVDANASAMFPTVRSFLARIDGGADWRCCNCGKPSDGTAHDANCDGKAGAR